MSVAGITETFLMDAIKRETLTLLTLIKGQLDNTGKYNLHLDVFIRI